MLFFGRMMKIPAGMIGPGWERLCNRISGNPEPHALLVSLRKVNVGRVGVAFGKQG